jgi:hypothetical protein
MIVYLCVAFIGLRPPLETASERPRTPPNSTSKTAATSAKQPLAWLRADLAAWTKLAADANKHARIRQTLQHWLKDADLAGIRDPAAVAKLPAGEKEACKKLWAEVADLLTKVAARK